MAELMNELGKLKSLPEDLHLLCPRQNDGDMEMYNQERVSGNNASTDAKHIEDISTRISEASVRREKFLSCMQLLAFTGEEIEPQQQWIWRQLEEALEKCDLCVKEYHKGKLWLVASLTESYDESEVDKFSKLLDDWDIKRISRNLDRAATLLKEVPPAQRTLPVLDRAAMLSMFEALTSEAFLNNEKTLRAHFDEPLALVQTNRTLKVPDYLPAVTKFLFDPNPRRNKWAVTAWSKFSRSPTTEEFDWAVKPSLLVAVANAAVQPFQPDHIDRLWHGLYLIVGKLTKEQITHNLRALEIDPCRLSVDHLGVPTPGLRSLLSTLKMFLEKSPGDFWDAMQTISPQAIVEQLFYNPQYESFLLQTGDATLPENPVLEGMLSWIEPFMMSLKGAHQPRACRTLTSQLLNRLQEPRFPAISRYHCFRTGLLVLIRTLRCFTDHESSRGSVARVILSETLEVVKDHIGQLLEPPKFLIQGSQHDIYSLCMDVVRNTLALECQSLKSEYEAILRQNSLHHGVSTYSAAIWDAVIRHLHEDNLALSTAALIGILPLVGLEKFPTKGEHSKEKTNFNVIYGHLIHLSCQILERLADFKPEHLDILFKNQDTSVALISALFSADLNTYQTAIDLIKTISGQSGRKEAIMHLLQSFFAITIYAFSWSFRRISNMKTFASAPRMIKTGTDIVDVLCDSQTGILRSRKLADHREAVAVQRLWEYQWQALTTIFVHTESWHRMGNDRSVMVEFCRDTIQFADMLFDQFPVFASALSEAKPSEAKVTREALLRSPTETMDSMVKWLRLKDEYLASTLVGIVSKLLRRLGELDVTVSEEALSFMEGVAAKSTVKTILTAQEKAELIRTLEFYYQKPLAAPVTVSHPKKQRTITAFVKPADAATSSSPEPTVKAVDFENFDDDEIPDEVLMQLSSSVELNKARIAEQKRPEKPRRTLTKASVVIPVNPLKPDQSVQSFREKREREKEAKKRRDMRELARLKGHLSSQVVSEAHTSKYALLPTPKGSAGEQVPADSMMVSSESDTEDSDEDSDPGILARKAVVKPDAVKEYEESKKKSLHTRLPVKKVKVVRSAKDMRARLSPDLSSLHRTLLSWDFFGTGDFPPNSGRTDYSLVSNTFADPVDYQKTFEPLLILEAWQGFQSAKEEGTFKPFEIKIATRLTVDLFIEISTSMAPNEVKDLGLGEADVILLSKSNNPTVDSAVPHCLARISRVNRKKGTVEISYRVNPNILLANFIVPGVTLSGARITSLTPLEREYGALMALRYYDLSDEIIKARPSPLLSYNDDTLKPILETYQVNLAQARAVKSAIDNDAFTLIQGPPGSGKTKTIVALVGALLTPTLSDQRIAPPRPSNDFPGAASKPNSKKLLVCAPSNAAVDELVMRFKEGVKTLRGTRHKISVVRLGRSDAINTNVMDVTLDELVNAKLNQSVRKNGNERDLPSYYAEHKETATKFNEVRQRLEQLRAQAQPVPPELEREFDLLKRKKAQLSQMIDNVRDKYQAAARDADLARRRIQQEIFDGTHVICATLSGSGHDMFQSLNIEFETVVIDEAAQSIELSALIPLKYGCSKCVLVGDPKQLPPTVLSREAARFQYEQSLFVRMQSNHPNDVHLLDTQYRMHPEISRFPSVAFYDNRLQDGPNMAKLRIRPWHTGALLGPYRFFDVHGLHSSAPKGHSLVNLAELRIAMQLYERLTTDCRTFDFTGKIGVITPYKGQLRELKAHFAARYGNSIFSAVEFNTTDAFQGRECEIIIFSCVRASNRGIGFLSDIRRMNVGLTRAKSSLWVLGNSQSLAQGEFWRALINDAQSRSLYTSGDIVKLLATPQAALNDIEMVDAPSENNGAASIPSSGCQSLELVADESRLSSGLSDRQLSSDLNTTTSSRETPIGKPKLVPKSLPDGASGGKSGLNKLATCGYCGSFKHMTHNCDNVEAKIAAQGTCVRCGSESHSSRDCNEQRCIQCGQFGHLANACLSTTLSKRQKERVAREEYRHSQAKQARTERQRQKQLEQHDPKVPVIRVPSTTVGLSTMANKRQVQNTDGANDAQGKRKLPESAMPTAPKAPKKLRHDIPTKAARASDGAGRLKHPLPPPPPRSDLVVPSKSDQRHQMVDADNRTLEGSNSGQGNVSHHNADVLSRPPSDVRLPPRPPPRRKKPVDPFIKPKRR